MSPTRHYFPKAIAPPPRKRRIRPQHDGVTVRVLVRGQSRLVSSRYAAQQMGRSKGGRRAQQLGAGHRWTPDTARQAALKGWATRRRPSAYREGVRIGGPARYRPRVVRVPIREQYARHQGAGVGYDREQGQWYVRDEAGGTRRLSERYALIRLGMLPPAKRLRGLVPEQVLQHWNRK